MDIKNSSLAGWNTALKTLATCFILSSLLGYGIGFLKIHQITNYKIDQAVTYYRGDNLPESETMLFPQSYASLLSVAHVHSFSQPLLLFIMGFIFSFSNASNKFKTGIIITIFLSSFVSNLSPWLVRYTSTQTIYLLPASQIFFGLSFIIMSWCSLKSMWSRSR